VGKSIHKIRHLFLDISFDGTELEASLIQNRLFSTYDRWLVPSLTKGIEKCKLDDDHYYLENLEIDAGLLGINDLEDQLGPEVEKAIEKTIKAKYLSSSVKETSGPSELHKKTERQHIIDGFISFLENGSLPWTFRVLDRETLEKKISSVFSGISREETGYFKTRLGKTLVLQESLQRLILQFSDKFLGILISFYSSENTRVIELVLEKLRKESFIPGSFEKTLWEITFIESAGGKSISESDLVLKTFYREPLSQKQKKNLEHIWPVLSDQGLTKKVLKSSEVKREDSETVFAKENEKQEAYYIDNAGLIILHPYISRFLKNLDIVRKNLLIDPERALCLIQYLATGNNSIQEYEVILPKVLCNIPVSTAVSTGITLSEKEIKTSSVLLESVIRNWDALGNTGIDGLRFNFFNRPGKLSHFQDYWLLQVEPRSYDILLEKLPWSVSIVQLPWMSQMINVEWR